MTAKRFIGRDEYFGSIVYDLERFTYLKLDKITTYMLKESIDKDPEEVCARCADEFRVARSKLHSFLDNLKARGLLSEQYGFAGEFMANRVLDIKLSAPLKIFLAITNGCNSYCRHCFMSSGKKTDDEMTLEELRNLAKELASLGVCQLAIAGGEPLTRADIFDFIEYARLHHIDISMTTNGSLVTERVARRLGELGLKSITVSLDGATQQTYELVRGKGLFDDVLTGIRYLRRYSHSKLGMRVTLMTTNIDEVPQFVKLAEDLGCDILKMNAVNPYGRAVKARELFLKKKDFLNGIKLALELGESASVRVELPIEKYLLKKDDSFALGLCVCGDETCEIYPNGDLLPCPFCYGQFIFGNVKTQPFHEVWKQGLDFNLDNPICMKCKGRGGKGEKKKGHVERYIKDIISPIDE